MKTEIRTIDPQVNKKPFPKLMKSVKNDAILFFHQHKKGVVINENERHELGEYSENWDMNCFEDLPINQQVILQNS